MNLSQYADVLDLDLQVRYINRQHRWVARYKNADTKQSSDDRFIESIHGTGSTPEEALNDYANKLKDLILVVNPSDIDHRSEHLVPDYIVGV